MSNLISVSDRGLMNHAGVATTVTGAMTAAEAIERAGLDFKVELRTPGYQVKGGIFKADKSGAQAIVRSDTGECFGYVGRRYAPIQNTEVFDWCDRLVGEGATYESAFSMWGGKQVGLTMRFPETINVGGQDAHDTYLFVRTAHDGKGAMTAAVTNVRLVCTNMINAVLRGATDRVRIHHLTNATGKIAAARDALQLAFAYNVEFEKEMQSLIQRTIDEDHARKVIDEVLAKHKFGGREEKVARIIDLTKTSETIQDDFRGTRYGVLQAATEWMDWERKAKTPQSNVYDLLDGRVRKAKTDLVGALAL